MERNGTPRQLRFDLPREHVGVPIAVHAAKVAAWEGGHAAARVGARAEVEATVENG
jgi:hypothetical protein